MPVMCVMLLPFELFLVGVVTFTPFASEQIVSRSDISRQQQQLATNEWPEVLPNEFCLLLTTIANSLDAEQVRSLCFISVEATKAGVCNRDDFSGMVLLDFFLKQMLIAPNDLTYLMSKLQSVDRMDMCSLIDQYNSKMLSLSQPLLPGNLPVEHRPPPYNPEFVSGK